MPPSADLGEDELSWSRVQMSYNPHPNSKIMLLLLERSPQGGESLLARGADLLRELPDELLQKFEEAGGVRQAAKSDTLAPLHTQQS